MRPDVAGTRLGTIVTDTRLKPLELRPGPGCDDGWVRIGGEEWVCATYLEADDREPWGEEQPAVEAGSLVPGEYADVRSSSAVVFSSPRQILKGIPARKIFGHTVLSKREEVEVDGRVYWKTASGEYIEASALKPYSPSTFHGIQLERGLSLPLILIMPGAQPDRAGVNSPSIVNLAAGRGFARVLDRSPVGRRRPGVPQQYRYRIGDDEWISSHLIRYAQAMEPPPDIEPDERWVDINLDEQVLVAYEGAVPVFVTLVSTGRLDPTPRGLFRVYLKHAATSMASEMGDNRPYQIETVPWTQFFYAGIALHCAYWHNGFGYPRSRGCVNLAPLDARYLYHWADPRPPVGWGAIYGLQERPGTLIRVHRGDDEPLHYYGYARDVAKARGVRVPAAPRLSDQLTSTKGEIKARIQAQKIRAARQAEPGAAAESRATQSGGMTTAAHASSPPPGPAMEPAASGAFSPAPGLPVPPSPPPPPTEPSPAPVDEQPY